MELEEMKIAWLEMSDQLEKQKVLTDKLIIDMTQERYKNKFAKISFYETIGAIICFVVALAIIINFRKLDTWYLIVCGIGSILYFLTLPTFVLRSIHRIKTLNLVKNSYKQILIDFTKRKKHMLFVQQLGISLNFILMIIFLPVAGKILSDKDIFITSNDIWYWYIPVMAIVLFFASRWGYRCYKSISNSAEATLTELEE